MSNPESPRSTGDNSARLVKIEAIPPTKNKHGKVGSRLRGYSDSARERIINLIRKDPENPIEQNRNSFEEVTDPTEINRIFTADAENHVSSKNPDTDNKLMKLFSLRRHKK